MDTIKVIIKKPYEPFEEAEIEKGYKSLRKIVEGDIQYIPFWEDTGLTCYGNEEAKILKLLPNLICAKSEEARTPETWMDPVCGTLVFTRTDDEGETISVEPGDLKKLNDRLNNPSHEYGMFNVRTSRAYEETGLMRMLLIEIEDPKTGPRMFFRFVQVYL